MAGKWTGALSGVLPFLIRKERITDYVFKKQYPFIHRIYDLHWSADLFEAVRCAGGECCPAGTDDGDCGDWERGAGAA